MGFRFILFVLLSWCNRCQLTLALTICPSIEFDVVSACCDSNIITIVGCQAVNSATPTNLSIVIGTKLYRSICQRKAVQVHV